MNRTIEIGPNDVLCGRGRESFHHEGNKRFRETVTSMMDQFRQAKTRAERSRVVASIWNTIRGRGGRFLKKNEIRANRTAGDGSGEWYQLSDQQAKEKVAHAIRDACANSMDSITRRGSFLSTTSNPTSSVTATATTAVVQHGTSAAPSAATRPAIPSTEGSEARKASDARSQAPRPSSTATASAVPSNFPHPETMLEDAFFPATSFTDTGPPPSSSLYQNQPWSSSNFYANLASLTRELKKEEEEEMDHGGHYDSTQRSINKNSMDLEPEPIWGFNKPANLKSHDQFPPPMQKKKMLTLKGEEDPLSEPQRHHLLSMNHHPGAPGASLRRTSPSLEEQPPPPQHQQPHHDQHHPVFPLTLDTIPHPAFWRGRSSGSSSSSGRRSISKTRRPYPASSILQDDLYPSSSGAAKLTASVSANHGDSPPARPKRKLAPPLLDPLLQNDIVIGIMEEQMKERAVDPAGSNSESPSLSPQQQSLGSTGGDSFLEAIDDVLGPLTPEEHISGSHTDGASSAAMMLATRTSSKAPTAKQDARSMTTQSRDEGTGTAGQTPTPSGDIARV